MDKLKYVKLKQDDGTYTDKIPLSVDGNYIDINGTPLNNILGTLATEDELQAIASGSPAGVYSTVSALTSADPNHNKIYLVIENGCWYYYSNGWQNGGIYQGTSVGLNSISSSNLDTDLQKSIKYNIPIYTLTDGSYISSTTNNIVTDQYSVSYSYSSPILLKKNSTIYLKGAGSTGVAIISECDSEGSNRSWKVKGVGTNIASYKYTASYDTYIIISSIKSKLSDIIINSYIVAEEDLPQYLDIKSDSNDITLICDNTYTDYIDGKFIRYGSGSLGTLSSLKASDYIEITSNSPMKFVCTKNFVTNPDDRGLAFYNEDKVYLSGVQYSNTTELTFTSPENAKYIRFTMSSASVSYILYYTSLKTYINNSFSILDNYKDLFKSFLHVGIIGDSLASGESVYKQNGTTKYVDLYEQSWGQYMARMSGNTYYNFSKGGLSTRSWLTNEKGYPLASDGEHDCEAYIIALGENDWRIEDYLGETTDINLEDYTQNEDTFYGNYAGIIQRMKALCPKAKFFLITLPSTNETKQAFNVAIRYMATIFNDVYILDLENDYYDFFRSGSFISSNSRGSHYNAVAYNYIGQLFMNWLSKIMIDNINDFRQIEFINTDYEWTS